MANILTEARSKLGITQSALAAELDLSQSAVCRMEKGKRPISRRTEYACRWLMSKDRAETQAA